MSPQKQPPRKSKPTATPRVSAALKPVEQDLEISFKLAAGIFAALALVFFFPAFLPGRGIFGTDYLAGGYQFSEFLSNQLRSGVIPKWVPYVYGGVPLHANPGSAYYPTRLLLMFLLPDSRVFAALVLTQFAIAGSGMYLLARELGVRTWIAFVAGLAFMFTGIIMSGLYSGHDGRIIVATFSPLIFFCLHRGIRTGRIAPFVGLAATLGFSLLCFQIQSNYYLLLAAAPWALYCGWHFREVGVSKIVTRLGLALAAVAFAFALASVNFLPFMDYVAESPRGQAGGRGYEYATSFSMPPAETAGFAIPEQQGTLGTYHGKSFFKQHTEYVGAFVLAMLVLGVYFARRNRYWPFFAIVALIGLSMSYGGYTPIYRLYYTLLPGVNKFRAPSISLFLVSMSLVIMAALTMETLARIRENAAEEEKAAKRAAKGAKVRTESDYAGYLTLGIVGVGVFMLLMSQAIPSPYGESTGWIRFGFFLALVGWLLWRWVTDRMSSRTMALILSIIVLADQWIVTRKYFQTVEPPDQVFAPDDVVQYLRSQNNTERVWVFPFGGAAVYHGAELVGDNRIPLRNYLMQFGYEQAGGEHGNQLERYNKFAGAGEKVYVDWHNFTGWPVFLSAANVRYIVSGLELQMFNADSQAVTKDIEEVYRGPSAIVYRNNLALPRAYLAADAQLIPNTDSALSFMKLRGWDPRRVAVVDRSVGTFPATPLQGNATIAEKSPDKVVVTTNANRPALLVLSDVYAHGWKAWVDNKPTPIVITNVAFRGVPVGAGSHTVRFEFDPEDLRTGRIISLTLFLVLVAFGVKWLLSLRSRPAEEPQAA
ncbi:MAG TPA: YfhO family protein [Gemmatimonadaceae bacterium]|nr:YfhO family protein [Gemmatimonadaceae bacterium]